MPLARLDSFFPAVTLNNAMSEFRLVRLNFGRNPTHFGETGIGLEETSERVRSDTLFSAWMSAFARSFGKDEIDGFLSKMADPSAGPAFRISSTFIYHRSKQGFVDYLPKLIERPPGYPDKDFSFAKTFRRLRFLPKSVWQRWYQGSGFTSQDGEDLQTYTTTPDNKTTQLAQAGCFDYAKTFKAYELPRVAIDRASHSTNFFHTGFVQFAWQPGNSHSTSGWDHEGVESLAGLYFLMEFTKPDSELESKLYQALSILGEEGIGGERSSGAGRFTTLSWEALPSDWQAIVNFQNGNRHTLISLFWDQSISLNWLGESARYALLERGGWIASPFSGRQLRRQMVRMFAEGSVFPNKPLGQLADVTPPEFQREDGSRVPHAIYRSGLALSLPVSL
jgi:CRISPR-associated protein Csm4